MAAGRVLVRSDAGGRAAPWLPSPVSDRGITVTKKANSRASAVIGLVVGLVILPGHKKGQRQLPTGYQEYINYYGSSSNGFRAVR